MTKDFISIIKKESQNKYPLNYSKMSPLSFSSGSKKLRITYEESDFHQTDHTTIGVFYKPCAYPLIHKASVDNG